MLLYRAQLTEEGVTVVAVAVRRRRGRPLFRIIVRYAGADGRMLVDRGQLWADLPAGVELTVAGYQQSGAELWITLGRVPPPSRCTGVDGAALADRFRLPIALQAWGVTAVQGALLGLQAVCRCRGGSLLVRGALRLTLETPGAPFRLRIPFCRVLGVEPGAAGLPEGLRWRMLAGVTGLQLRVEPGGLVKGEAVVALHCEGRPPAAGGPGQVRPAMGKVRELSGRIVRVAAEAAGDEHVLIHGSADLDLYWFDGDGLSHWTGRQVPFGALIPLDGLLPDDRLEATAILERLHHRLEGGGVEAHLIVTVTVTALRPEVIKLGEGCYRLERVVGSAATTIEVSERFFSEAGAAPGGGVRPVPAALPAPGPAGGVRLVSGALPVPGPAGGVQLVSGAFPVPGPAGGWQAVTVLLSTPEAATGAAAGRWTVHAAVSGTPAGEAPYPAPLRATMSGSVPAGPRALLTVIPMLEQLDATGLCLRTALAWGPALPALAEPAPHSRQTVCVAIALPGPVRSVVAAGAEGEGRIVRVWAVVALERRGLALASGNIPRPHLGHPVQVTVIPTVEAGEWRLHVTLGLAGPV